MKKPGLVSQTFGLAQTTLERTTATVDKSLLSIQHGATGIATNAETWKNESLIDLLDSRFNIAKQSAQHRVALKELGYSDEQINALLSVEVL